MTSSCTSVCRPCGPRSISTSTSTSPSSPAQEKVCLGSTVVVGPREVIQSKRTSLWGRRLKLAQENRPKFESVHKINSCCSLRTRDIISQLGITSTDVQQHTYSDITKCTIVYCRNDKVTHSIHGLESHPSPTHPSVGWVSERVRVTNEAALEGWSRASDRGGTAGIRRRRVDLWDGETSD